jgi:hypothetical protein
MADGRWAMGDWQEFEKARTGSRALGSSTENSCAEYPQAGFPGGFHWF